MKSTKMSYRLIEPPGYPSPERIRTLTDEARQERAEAIAELFGFGFTALARLVGLRRDSGKTPSLAGLARERT
jgi:hypothetical protein